MPSSLFQISAAAALPPLPKDGTVLGFGGVMMDFLATVNSYPNPDEKVNSTSLKIQGGGNVGNALTCAARLGLNARLISKVADDANGRGILEELQADNVDTSYLLVSQEGSSPFVFIIVDSETKSRTCIINPGLPPMIPEDLSPSSLISAFDGVRLFYSDIRLCETAIVVAKEAYRRRIPILVDAESKTEKLEDLLTLAEYVVCAAKFPQDKRKFRAKGIGMVNGRLLMGTAEKIPPSELVDTTGAGDAFIGAVLYAICSNMPSEKMLPFASQVAAANCRALGARTGLPYRADPRLTPFLQ